MKQALTIGNVYIYIEIIQDHIRFIVFCILGGGPQDIIKTSWVFPRDADCPQLGLPSQVARDVPAGSGGRGSAGAWLDGAGPGPRAAIAVAEPRAAQAFKLLRF